MRVLLLGGTSRYAKDGLSILASSDIVSEILIAGRDLGKAQKSADEVGKKAEAVSLDINDHDRLVKLARKSDIVVNTAGPEWEVVLKALSAAIEAGTNYCDIGADSLTTEKALEFDGAARAKGVTALVGMGFTPGLTNLLMVHASRKLDSVEQVQLCWFIPVLDWGDLREEFRASRKSGSVAGGWQMAMKWATPPIKVFQNGSYVTNTTEAEELKIQMPGVGEIPAVLGGSAESITLPRSLPGVRTVRVLWSWFPFSLNTEYRELGARVARGEITLVQSTIDFYESVIRESGKSEVFHGAFSRGMVWTEATGIKDGVRSRYSCWPASAWPSTSTPPALASLKILSGEVRKKGVLAPEECVDPLPFFNEVAQKALKEGAVGQLLNESWQPL
jgi:saccharopine dehydrogenase-like NADP-dependent oxidoreductase